MAHQRPWLRYVAAIIVIISLAALVEYLIGHPLICECGTVKLWYGNNYSPENSQHIADWYTPSHIIHGFLFYWLLWLVNKRASRRGIKISVGWLLVAAVFIEAAWEIFENTEFIMNRYREATISLDYFGDSIVNSMMDIVWMIVGFALAYRLPVWASIATVIVFEAFVGYMVRDNLTLNVIMLVYPLEVIKEWQGG